MAVVFPLLAVMLQVSIRSSGRGYGMSDSLRRDTLRVQPAQNRTHVTLHQRHEIAVDGEFVPCL